MPTVPYDYYRNKGELVNLPLVCNIMKTFLLSLITLLSLKGFSQDVTGIWRGYFNQVEYVQDPDGKKIAIPRERYKFEVQLDQENNRMKGVTYSYLSTVFYGKAVATGTFNAKTKKIVLDELKIVEVKMSGFDEACIMQCFLQYSKSGDEEFLEGTYTSMNVRDSTNCGRGTVFLRRVVNSDFYKEPFLVNKEKGTNPPATPPATAELTKKPPVPPAKPPVVSKPKTAPAVAVKKPGPAAKNPLGNSSNAAKAPETNASIKPNTAGVGIAKLDSLKKPSSKIGLVPTPRVLTARENEVVKTITTSANEITIKVYDNGTIDNDTVSVYLDKKLVVSKQRLTEKAIEVKFQLDDTNDFHQLVMVAENLGEIPPNTSLMVVTAGTKQYEVRITSTEQKNAVVIFKYEKDK